MLIHSYILNFKLEYDLLQALWVHSHNKIATVSALISVTVEPPSVGSISIMAIGYEYGVDPGQLFEN